MELTPQRLVRAFGRKSRPFQQVVQALARSSPPEQTIEQWQQLSGLATSTLPTQEQHYLFILHTYYAIIAKLLALRMLHQIAWPMGDYLRILQLIEAGTIFADAGIDGFGEDSLFGWYLQNDQLADTIPLVFERMQRFDSYTADDLLKWLYLSLVPRALRHRLGEYYTPDWLASYLLQQVDYDPEATLLDPNCGSGTFLVQAIQAAKTSGINAEQIMERVVGFDIHPLAVITARVNYLLALGPHFPDYPLTVPITRKDAILEAEDGAFDFVVGNPPWINWQNLPADYRQRTKGLWLHYGLFPHQGLDTILGTGKKDLSMLMTMVALDRYLAPTGRLGFVITQTVFKTSGAGQGFRRFSIDAETPIKIEHVDDMSTIQPFNDAKCRTAVILMRKGHPTSYPIPYTVWKRARKNKHLRHYYELASVLEKTQRLQHSAVPVDADDPTSAWITGTPQVLQTLQRVIGPAQYVAHEGINTGGANGVYWLEVLRQEPDGHLRVRNMADSSRRAMPTLEASLEPEMVYPMLRGRDVMRWSVNVRHHMLVVQNPDTRTGHDPEWLQTHAPQTYAYLKRFEDVLWARRSFRRYFGDTAPFYTMFGVGHYSFAPYKVVWRYIATEMTAAVVTTHHNKVIIPDHRLMLIDVESLDEAHFVAACLNNTVSRYIVAACTIATQMSTHILEKLPVPRYDAEHPLHHQLAMLSQAAHQAAANQQPVDTLEDEIDQTVAALWQISATELQSIRYA